MVSEVSFFPNLSCFIPGESITNVVKGGISVVTAVWNELVTKCQAVWNAFRELFYTQKPEVPLAPSGEKQTHEGQELVPLMRDVFRNVDFPLDSYLALTSTCKGLVEERFRHIATNSALAIPLITRLLRRDSLTELPASTGPGAIMRALFWLVRSDDPMAYTPKILKLFPDASYRTQIDLRAPAVGDSVGEELVLSVARRFPNIRSVVVGDKFLITRDGIDQLLAICKENIESISGGRINILMNKELLGKITSSCRNLNFLEICPTKSVIGAADFEKMDFPPTLTHFRCGSPPRVSGSVKAFNHLFASCPQLISFDLIQARMFPDEWKTVQFPKQLLTAYFAQCSIDNEGLQKLLNSCPDLALLSLVGCANIGAGAFENIPISEKMKTLLCPAARFGFDDLAQILRSFPQLEKLVLFKSSLNYDIKKRIPHVLKEVDLSNTMLAGDEITAFCSEAKNLQRLDLNNCSLLHVPAGGSISLPPTLVSIDVSGTSIDDAWLGNLLASCPLLEEVGLKNCRKLSQEAIANCQNILAERKKLTS